jgi:exonuclease SbcC
VQTLANQRQSLGHQLEAKRVGLTRLQQSVQQAEQAIALCQTNRAAYEDYQGAEQLLQALAQEQRQRQALQHEYQTQQKTQSQKQVELARWQTQLESFAATEAELARLQPQIATQVNLEARGRRFSSS